MTCIFVIAAFNFFPVSVTFFQYEMPSNRATENEAVEKDDFFNLTIKLSCLHSPETTMIPSDIVSTSKKDCNEKRNVTSNMKNLIASILSIKKWSSKSGYICRQNQSITSCEWRKLRIKCLAWILLVILLSNSSFVVGTGVTVVLGFNLIVAAMPST